MIIQSSRQIFAVFRTRCNSDSNAWYSHGKIQSSNDVYLNHLLGVCKQTWLNGLFWIVYANILWQNIHYCRIQWFAILIGIWSTSRRLGCFHSGGVGLGVMNATAVLPIMLAGAKWVMVNYDATAWKHLSHYRPFLLDNMIQITLTLAQSNCN